jgi:Beta-propeller repeat
MKPVQLVFILLIAVTPAKAQVPGVDWVNKVTGSNSKSLGIDPQGNLYTLGNIGPGTFIDVDPGPGIHIAYGDSGTVLIYKFTGAGAFVWAKQLPFGVTAECVRADASQNVYVIGQFSLTKDFDPGPAVYNLTGLGQNDVFILKLNADGNFVWVKTYGGTTMDVGLSITVSASGNVFSTGYFDGTSDFDPGPAQYNLTSQNQADGFVAALDANGNFLWAQQITGAFSQGTFIAGNSSNDLLVTGSFNGVINFNGSPITSTGGGDIFMLKMNMSGGFAWAKTVGSIGTDQNASAAFGPGGEVYTTGSFTFPIDMDPGAGVQQFTPAGTTDIFVLKLAANGSFVWARQLGGATADIPKAIAADAAGNVYTTGIFQNLADFDPGPSVYNISSNGSNDAFICRLSSDGSFGWAAGFGAETSEDKGDAVAVDAGGAVYLAGTFQGHVDFDPGAGVLDLINSTTSNFLMKFGSDATSPVESIANGNWSDAAIWSGGAVPAAGDSVVVKHIVTMAADSEVFSLTVQPPNGHVTVQTGANLKIFH